MPRTLYGAMHHIETIATPLVAVTELATDGMRKLRRSRRRPARGLILQPGSGTPHWNALAQAAAKLLRRRGDKVRLARVLGISRQRLHLLLKAKTACPDAERTLLLQEWVDARRRGQDLA